VSNNQRSVWAFLIKVGPNRSRLDESGQRRCRIARLILVNGPPASGKSTLARRYVDGHDRAALVEIDTLRMTLPNWEKDEASRLVAIELAGAAIVEHLCVGRDVVMAQYFGRLGYIVSLEDLARERRDPRRGDPRNRRSSGDRPVPRPPASHD